MRTILPLVIPDAVGALDATKIKQINNLLFEAKVVPLLVFPCCTTRAHSFGNQLQL